jgi:hypothetical protein
VLRVVPRRWLRIMAPAVALAAVVGLDLYNGREPVLGLVVIAPLFGANIVGPRLTAAYAVAALVCAALLGCTTSSTAPRRRPPPSSPGLR